MDVKCSKSEKNEHLFPQNKKLDVQLRGREEYVINHAAVQHPASYQQKLTVQV